MTAANETTRVEGYVDAGGVPTYYEAEGAGEPLVLLHGGLCAIETFAGLRAGLTPHFRVYLPERPGTGRTRDVDGPMTFQLMAEVTIAFLEAVGLESANILGFSDGSAAGMSVALQRPDLVRKLVLIGQPVNNTGAPAEAQEMLKLERMPMETVPPMLRDLYAAVSPDGPEHWDVVVNKEWRMIRDDSGLVMEDLRRLTAPTLLITAEQDFVTVEHAQEMERTLRDARLVVVPDATHGLPIEKPEIMTSLVLDFLG